MSYCLNPACSSPQNPDQAQFCQRCQTQLILAERYLALKLIGQGNFGRTFLAIDQLNAVKPQCLIKQFCPKNHDTSSGKQAVDLFKQEALRPQELGQHAQIPDFVDYFEYQSSLNQNGFGQYLVQEFIDGQNLAEKLANEGAFSEIAIRQLLNQVLPVLQFVHNHQVIHRDIKPDNIIDPTSLVHRGASQNPLVVLVDFGAAKLATATTLHQTGTLIGSAEYTAPEQLVGKAIFASDLYSLGVTCIHLLTQVPPFDLFDIHEAHWVWQDYLTHPVSKRLSHVLDKLLQHSPKGRYQSAADVLQDLNADPRQVIACSSLIDTGISSPKPVLSWQCLHTVSEHSAMVHSVAISSEKRVFASGGGDSTVYLRQLDTGQQLRTCSGSGVVKSIAISPDSKRLASAGEEPSILVWSLDTGEQLHTLSGHSGDVRSIAFSADGTLLASGSGDDTLKLWCLKTGECLHTFNGRSRGVNSFTRSPCAVSSVCFHPNGQLLASSSDDKTIKLWNLQPVKLQSTFIGHADEVTSIAISPNGEILASGSLDQTINLWNLRNGELIMTLKGHSGGICAVAISPDGTTLVSGSLDDTINVWDLPTVKLLGTLTGHRRRVNSVAISADGSTLVSSSGDRTIKIWHRLSEMEIVRYEN